jgi:hypothetical protein
MNIDKDESNYTKRNKCSNIPVHEVINLDSTDDEEDVQSPGREKLQPSGAMNGGDLHTEQLETVSHAGLAQGAMNGSDLDDEDAPMWDLNEFGRHPTKWHYIDRQGNTHGPFLLTQLRKWRNDGYFHESFKVWPAGGDNEPSHFSYRCPQDVSVTSSPSCLSSLFFV